MAENNNDLKLLFKYPLISLTNSAGNHRYTGTISVNENDFAVEIIDYKLQSIKSSSKIIANLNKDIYSSCGDANIIDCLDRINESILQLCKPTITKSLVNNTNIYKVYRKVLHEYSEFVKFHFNINTISLARDLSEIILTKLDDEKRSHSLQIGVNFNDNDNIFYVKHHDLPRKCTDDQLIKESSSLTCIYNQFLAILDQLQPYFDAIRTLDDYCWVLEPINSNNNISQNYRRLKLDDNLSVLVTIDPFNACARPDLKFLGPERFVEPYRWKLNANLAKWDDKINIYQGLVNLLEIESFPLRSTSSEPGINDNNPKKEQLIHSGECCICFASLNLNDQIPDVVCKNRSCEHLYHTTCLFEWLTSINGRRMFNEIWGPCPNCEKKISCTIVNDR